MTTYNSKTSQQDGSATEQIRELRQAIQENAEQLQRVRKQRLCAKEEIIQCTRETERRVELMMEKSGVVDILQQLGQMLQEERQLSEQLNGQDSSDRNDLQEMNERITNKAKSLAAEILEVEQRLAEAKACNMQAAQAVVAAPAGRPRRAQRKPK